MQSELEWNQKKFIKFEVKKGGSKEENKLKQGFQNSIERWRKGWEFCLEEFWPFIAFVMLQIRFTNHWLIRISMIYMYIKLEVKKNDTAVMTTAINEACIGWLHENCYLERQIFLVQEMRRDSFPHLQSFPQTVGLGEEVGQSIHGRGNKQNERRRNIFGKMGNTGGILQGDNSGGYCFVISLLIPMKFSKKSWLWNLKCGAHKNCW